MFRKQFSEKDISIWLYFSVNGSTVVLHQILPPSLIGFFSVRQKSRTARYSFVFLETQGILKCGNFMLA